MKRLDRIIHHPVFQQELERLEFYEKDRIYCRHNLEHLLAVARTAQIFKFGATSEYSPGCFICSVVAP